MQIASIDDMDWWYGLCLDDMDKFQQKEMKEIRPIKNTWYDWIINSEPIRKSVGGFKDKIISFFKTNTPKQTPCMEEEIN